MFFSLISKDSFIKDVYDSCQQRSGVLSLLPLSLAEPLLLPATGDLSFAMDLLDCFVDVKHPAMNSRILNVLQQKGILHEFSRGVTSKLEIAILEIYMFHIHIYIYICKCK